MKTKALHICVVAAVWAATSCHTAHRSDETTDLQEVDVARPEEETVVLHKTYPGYLGADKEVDLVARVDGYLVAQNYDNGDFVRKGTVLFRIEDSNYRDAVQKAQAALSTARSTRDYAASRYAAMTEALKSDAVSEMEVIQAKSQLEESEASIKTAEAALHSAQTQLSYCTVLAPCDGHVSKSNYTVGAYLAGAGAPVKLASIYDDSTVKANFSVEDAEYLTRLREAIASGDVDYKHIPVTFSDSLAHSYTAELCYQDPHVSTSTGTMVFQAVINNPYGELRSGMYVSVDLPFATEENAILVRDASIGTDQLGKYLYVVTDSDRVVSTPVHTGQLSQDTLRIITKGIGRNDRYVTKAMMKVRDGMTVKPIIVD